VEEAKKQGLETLALTDINNSTGIIDFVRLCNDNGIKPVAGIEFRDNNRLLYTGVAGNNEGFRELNEFLSHYNIQKEKLPEKPPVFQNAIIIYPFASKQKRELRDHERIAVRPEQVNKLFSSDFRHDQSKLIAYHPVSFKDTAGYDLHRNLRAVNNNILISMLKPEQQAKPYGHFLGIDAFRKHFESYPQVIYNTEDLFRDCTIEFDYQVIKNKASFTGSRYEDKELLEKLAYDGLDYRYGRHNKEALKRIDHELKIIDRLGFSAYFLIAWDIIRYSMSRGFYHVGRGSGANSIVAYCLKITDVDPIELDLYFERFINPKRTSPPDFDIDYSWKDRDEVHEYIFRRYGKKYTALLGSMSTFRGKSIFRELGKVHGLPKEEIDALIEKPEDELNKNAITKKIHELSGMMVDFPNIRSIHAGGVLISEKPITYYTALDMPPKGFQTTQWDMYVAEDFGFEKLDILSQRGIGHIKEAVEIIVENKGVKVDEHNVKQFKTDPQVKHQLKTAETNGCFYIESPAMRGLLRKLKCDNYLSLVAASSIVRPGVAKSGMMREYIYRFHNPENFKYIHPVMKEQLEETFGVMVYQEDVIKVCHHFAGLDLADADVLRRAMSGKSRSKKEFQRIVEKFFANCQARGYPDEIAKEVWRQIESFGGYSFSKAHSASYAVESFQSLFLKAHYPLEFMTAVINNFGGFYSGWVYFNEARRQGANIQLPCVNHSNYKTRIIGKDIYIGFVHIANLENKLGKQIPRERELNGPYHDLENFVDRIPMGMEQLIILIRTGALAFTCKPKSELLWEAHLYLKRNHKNTSLNSLFHTRPKQFKLPQLEVNQLINAYDEIELIGFPVSMTYFEMLRTGFRGDVMAEEMINYVGKKVRMLGHLVAIKYVRTVKKDMMNFGTFLDVKGEMFDTTHFSKSLKEYPFQGQGLYLMMGRIDQEFGYATLTVEKMAKMPVYSDPREK
jgi:DNA-directed DNA polymerase III PolC